MKTLLVNPPYSEFVYENRKKAASLDAPLSIAYLASVLEKSGHDVEILDANAFNLTIDETINKISKSDAKVVGITSTTTVMPITYKICDGVKKLSDKIMVVGGPHVTFVPERTLNESKGIDIVARGEGEDTLLELVKKKGNPAGIKGLTYRKGNRIVKNPDRIFIKDINGLPFPARHLLPMHAYRSGSAISSGTDGHKYASMITSRGCPNKCTYCSSSHFWGTRVRFRTPENVIEEIEKLVKEYGTKEIFFKDDTFTFSPIRTRQICDLLIKKNLGVRWSCYARVNTVNKEILTLMKKAGCFALDFGIESGNQEVLNRIKKNITLDQARKALKAAREVGIITYSSFMFGLPGDTFSTSIDTINFAIELNPDVAQFFITTPFPGTELYDEAISKKWIDKVKSWGDLNIATSGCNFKNDSLTSEEIKWLVSYAYKKFYLRPGFFWYSIKRVIKEPQLIKRYINGGIALMDLM